MLALRGAEPVWVCADPRPRPCCRSTQKGPAPWREPVRWCALLVGDTGIEPVTSSVSGKRSPAELIALHRSEILQWNGQPCEVGTGFEPVYTALQAVASPLGHPTAEATQVTAWTSSSGRRDSNPRPSPWQGDALPTALRPRASDPAGSRSPATVSERTGAFQTGRISGIFGRFGGGTRPVPDIAAPRRPADPHRRPPRHVGGVARPPGRSSTSLEVVTRPILKSLGCPTPRWAPVLRVFRDRGLVDQAGHVLAVVRTRQWPGWCDPRTAGSVVDGQASNVSCTGSAASSLSRP